MTLIHSCLGWSVLTSLPFAAFGCSSNPSPGSAVVKTGEIQIATSTDTYSVDAWFYPLPVGSGPQPRPPFGSACTTSTAGACQVVECEKASSSGGGSSDSAQAPTAGEIGITGGSIPAGGINVSAGAKGTYAAHGSTSLWSGGEPTSVKATGGDIPAFDQRVTAPSVITVTAPAFAGTTPLTIDRAQGLVVTWTGGTVGEVQVLGTSEAKPKATTIWCTFPANAGTATVPASAFRQDHRGGVVHRNGHSQVEFDQYGT